MAQLRIHPIALSVAASLAIAGGAQASDVIGTQGTDVQTMNGTPVVNINAANAAGISRNTFSQFDVDAKGVVFNNNIANGASVLVGGVQANANLGGKAASVIVADVNSAQASRLNGAMEVSGAPAHLIVANPAGISCDGCGSANTHTTPVLTLAAARFAPTATSPLALDVDTARATPATVEISAKGLDNDIGQVNLLSRAIKVNGTVKALNIEARTGTAFEGDAKSGAFQGKLTRGVANAPTVALDVSKLGGMYANRIVLEGSEHGLGVNNEGIIQAGQGGFVQELFGNDQPLQGQSTRATYQITAKQVAGLPDAQRPVEYRGLSEEQIFQKQRASYQQELAAYAGMMRDESSSAKRSAINNLLTLKERSEWEAQAAKQREAEEQARAQEQARWEAEQLARAEEQARMEAEHKARWEAEQLARAGEQARLEAEQKARWEAEQLARAEEQARQDAEVRAHWEARQQQPAAMEPGQAAQHADFNERLRAYAEQQARFEAERQAAWEAELSAKWEAALAVAQAR